MGVQNKRGSGLRSFPHPSGQGLVETALFFPILLIVLSGLIEFGFMLNEYMVVQDATRNAARFSSNGLHELRDTDQECKTTRDFYRQTACVFKQEIESDRPDVILDMGDGDDVVISVFSVQGGAPPNIEDRAPIDYGEQGWSWALDHEDHLERNHSSKVSNDDFLEKLSTSAPNSGYVLVEVFYSYTQKLKLPWITAFVKDPIELYLYAVMPLSSAEPQD